MSQYGIQLDEKTPKIPLACEEDTVIMETFLEKGFSNSNLKILNKVRLHLEAFTLSDICTGNGEEITTSA